MCKGNCHGNSCKYSNPYMEVFYVATTLAGIYPFETLTQEERESLTDKSEPIFFMNDVEVTDEEEIEDMENEREGASELTQLSPSFIRKIPVTRHLSPMVATKIHGVDNGMEVYSSSPPTRNELELPSMMKLYIRQAIDTQIETWKKEGKIAVGTSEDAVDKLAQQLQRVTCSKVSSRIKGYITGEIKVDKPVPVLTADKKRHKQSPHTMVKSCKGSSNSSKKSRRLKTESNIV